MAIDTIPGVEEVSADTWVFGLPMPPGHMPYTLCYAIRDAERGLHLIDAGWDTEENWALLAAVLETIGHSIADVRSVTCTHLHPDHVGLAPLIRAASGATVALHVLEHEVTERWAAGELDAWGIPDAAKGELARAASGSRALTTAGFTADVQLQDGDVLAIPGRSIRVLHTPGHTAGHVCLVDDASGLLFTGDHLLPTVFSGIGLGGAALDPIDDYLSSLSRILEFDPYQACPGHTARFSGIAERCGVIARHHLARTREVDAALTAEPEATVWQIAERLTWTAGWSGLHDIYLASALAQTAMHVAFLRSGRATAQYARWEG